MKHKTSLYETFKYRQQPYLDERVYCLNDVVTDSQASIWKLSTLSANVEVVDKPWLGVTNGLKYAALAVELKPQAVTTIRTWTLAVRDGRDNLGRIWNGAYCQYATVRNGESCLPLVRF